MNGTKLRSFSHFQNLDRNGIPGPGIGKPQKPEIGKPNS